MMTSVEKVVWWDQAPHGGVLPLLISLSSQVDQADPLMAWMLVERLLLLMNFWTHLSLGWILPSLRYADERFLFYRYVWCSSSIWLFDSSQSSLGIKMVFVIGVECVDSGSTLEWINQIIIMYFIYTFLVDAVVSFLISGWFYSKTFFVLPYNLIMIDYIIHGRVTISMTNMNTTTEIRITIPL